MARNQLSQLFVLANEFKEGDLNVGGTRDDHVRREARNALADLSLGEIARADFVEDQVTEALHRSLDPQLAGKVVHLTVAELKQILLSPQGASWIERYRNGVSSEAIAAVVKIMTNGELGTLSCKLFNPLPGKDVAVGSPGHFGSRIQPNSPGDDETEILLSILEGLAYGCGDVILGLNPASDDVDTIIRLEQLLQSVVERLQLPTRFCVLSDIVKQTTARSQTKVDVGFQSLAGTSKAILGMVGLDVDGLLALAPGFDGLYFETGQGSAVTNQAAEGVDMVTLEARAYGVARLIYQRTGSWMIVNDVAGFIGPEVFRTGEQLLRACLEDTAMAKLHGITMGLDVCATFHMGIGPAELRTLTELIVGQAAPAYLMAVAGNADPMLGYMTTSFREHPRLRRQTGRHVASAMQQRLIELCAMTGSGADALYAVYHKAGGDTRSLDTLRDEGTKKIRALAERGFDLGYGCDENYGDPPEANARITAIYSNARRALYATMDEAVISTSSPRYVRVHTRSSDRDDYLAHPATGELIDDEDTVRIQSLYPARRPQVQVVVSDGLNANAVNENLRSVLPGIRRELQATGPHVSEIDIVIENGRVRAGYHVGSLLETEMIIHLIGERPGTGINTLSAYLTYGLDEKGQSRWGLASGFDHSLTTAVCGIHRRGKTPERAVEEISRLVKVMFAERCSGIALPGARGAGDWKVG
ncbi:MAG TPA: ethanolamine ammonia-lyase subunit EutB [Pyrinomonadaceae bacterium]|nr:ethanolamine ammonia-lyase subunit EutB [Pyrinomonadaceae bacterium]